MEYGDARLPPRFWAKVDPNGDNGCWVWTASTRRGGYGQFWFEAAIRGSHVITCRLEYGFPDPTTPDTLHRCDNPPCCNPAHLYWGNHSLNMFDAIERGLHWGKNNPNAAKTHCKNGHTFDAANTKWTGKQRVCRACSREYTRQYRLRKASAA